MGKIVVLIFFYEDKVVETNSKLQLVVDIVSGGGSGCWIKVVARNPRALAVNSQGGAQFGQKNILDQVISSCTLLLPSLIQLSL